MIHYYGKHDEAVHEFVQDNLLHVEYRTIDDFLREKFGSGKKHQWSERYYPFMERKRQIALVWLQGYVQSGFDDPLEYYAFRKGFGNGVLMF